MFMHMPMTDEISHSVRDVSYYAGKTVPCPKFGLGLQSLTYPEWCWKEP